MALQSSLPRASKSPELLSRIEVGGFKSIWGEQSIEIRPLTILAGTNGSGKSSMIQPLLLLKQTLEATYDPGALLLNGPLVRFTDARQLLSRKSAAQPESCFRVGAVFGETIAVRTEFRKGEKVGFDISQMLLVNRDFSFTLKPGMSHEDVQRELPEMERTQVERALQDGYLLTWEVMRDRCFLVLQLRELERPPGGIVRVLCLNRLYDPLDIATACIKRLIHVPALRGNPERLYPVTAVGREFTGRFETYVASVIAQWETDGEHELLDGLNEDLLRLELSWKASAKRVSDAEVELQVGRLPRPAGRGGRDLVSIADAGFGVSQAMPVLVALRVATPKHLVYIEQPEIHLHPRAQVALAILLADAANRGVKIVAETHSQ